ncbi:MAG: alpha/beta hydrolase [Acidimicrobiales bacterium]
MLAVTASGCAGRAAARAAAHLSTTTSSTTVPAPPPSTTTTAAPGPPYAVADDAFTVVDTTRPTPTRGSVPGSPTRTLRVLVRKPIGAPSPLPLVVFGPGFDATPEMYTKLLDGWAAAGYLVAAVDFPGSGGDLPGPPSESDIPQQAKDLSYLVTVLLGGREGPVDPRRIAATGHSDGGSTVVMLAENPASADHRFRAYLVLAGQIPDGVAGPWNAATPGTLLCMVGTADQYDNLSLTGTAYRAAAMTKAMVVVPGGDHEQIFVGSGAVPDEVRAATLRFLAAALAPGHDPSEGDLAALLAAPPGDPPYQVTAG